MNFVICLNIQKSLLFTYSKVQNMSALRSVQYELNVGLVVSPYYFIMDLLGAHRPIIRTLSIFELTLTNNHLIGCGIER